MTLLLLFTSIISSSIVLSSTSSAKNVGKKGVGSGSTPNIIFFILDDMGYSDISATGAEYTTPNLDDFYSNSIELTSHYIGLLCSPSRTQFLTGRYAWNFGVSNMDAFGYKTLCGIPTGVPTVADLFKQYTNYATYAISKWHVGYSAWEQTATYRGFDHFYGFYGTSIYYTNKTNDLQGYIDWRDGEDVDYETLDTFTTWAERDRLMNIINQHGINGDNYEEPFYVYAALEAPHIPLTYVWSENVANCEGVDASRYRKVYCQNMMAVDQLFGEVTQGLKDNDIWDDTLIVFTSDNGGQYQTGGCNFPYRGDKGAFFEGGIKVIALVGGGYIPQDQMGWKRGGIMHSADWTPTLLSLAGLDINQVSTDLYNNLYAPLFAKHGISSSSASSESESGYGISQSFDGYDLSRWLIYGNENDNNRTNAPLSISIWNNSSPDSAPIGLTFYSPLTNHRYKLIYGSQEGEYCQYCTDWYDNSRYRCQTGFPTEGNYWLFDLTLDFNETTNLYDATRFSKQQLKQYVENNNKTNQFYQKQKKKLLKNVIINTKETTTNSSSSYNYKLNSAAGVELQLIEEIEDVWDYFLYSDGDSIVDELWNEGREIVHGYTQNELFSDYTGCCDVPFIDAGNPAIYGAWTPFFSFEEYTTHMEDECGNYMTDALMELYTSIYSGN